MKKSKIFNKRYPAPLDQFVYPIYKQYLIFQQEIIDNWKQDFVSQRIATRAFADLSDCRLDIKTSPTVESTIVLSLKPVIGQEVQDIIDYYTRFFRLYALYTKLLFSLIDTALEMQNRKKIQDIDLPLEFPANVKQIAIWVMLLKVLVSAFNADKLPRHYLEMLETGATLEDIDAMLRNVKLEGLSDKFEAGGHFFDDPDSDLVGAYWKHARKIPINVDN